MPANSKYPGESDSAFKNRVGNVPKMPKAHEKKGRLRSVDHKSNRHYELDARKASKNNPKGLIRDNTGALIERKRRNPFAKIIADI